MKIVSKRFFVSDTGEAIYFRGEYSELRVKKTVGNITVKGANVKEIDLVEVIDLKNNQTDFFQNVKGIIYLKDIGPIDITRDTPIPVAVTLNVGNVPEDGVYHIEAQDILKHQIDFNTDKFTMVSICDSKGGNATLEGGQVIFKADAGYKGAMSFRYIFENEYGHSSNEKTPVLLRTSSLPKDEKFIQQLWYLEHVNVIPVWDKYTGKGVKVAVYDSAFLPSHPDIDGNVINKNDFNVYSSQMVLSQHALQVASIIAAESNDILYTGIAPNAKIGSYQAYGGDDVKHSDLGFFLEYDVINNSWVPINYFSSQALVGLYMDDFKKTVTKGRDGLGGIIVFASGNSGMEGVDSNYGGINTSPYIIVVGGINKPKDLLFMEKQVDYFATPGANILVSAPSSNIALLSNNEFSISDIIKSKDSNALNIHGTSFSAPMVSGTVALMLEANPKLGYRDVQEILAVSAKMEENGVLTQWSWNFNKADSWNGGGYHFSHQYGFGLVDAQAAVRMAESWPLQQTVKNIKTLQGEYEIIGEKIDDNNLLVFKYVIDIPKSGVVEYIEQNIDIEINGNPQEVNLYLISPSNTTSFLMYKPFYNPKTDDKLSNSVPQKLIWNFGSTNFRGEEAKGGWSFIVESTSKVHVKDLDIKISFKAPNTLKQMIYTDEFKLSVEKNGEARKDITKEQNIDIVNAAAVSSGIKVDFRLGELVIQNVNVKLREDTKLKAIISTDYDDEITISDNQNISLILNEGNDVIAFSGYDNVITIRKISGNLTVHHFQESFIIDVSDLGNGHCWQLSDNIYNNIIMLDNSLNISEYYS